MNAPTLPQQLAPAWFGDVRFLAAERIATGFSGAVVYRCRLPEGEVALRGWPAGTSRSRIAWIHQSLRAAFRNGCRLLAAPQATPSGKTLVTHAGRHWECAPWLPGRAWQPHDPFLAATAAVRAGSRAIASFHESLADHSVEQRPSPTLRVRTETLAEMAGWLDLPLCYQQAANQSGLDFAAAETIPRWLPAVERQLKTIWQERGGWIRAGLEARRQVPYPQQPVLRDVHREHVLFQRQAVSGLIDFDALRIDAPAVDLARFLSSFYDGAKPAVSSGAPPRQEKGPLAPADASDQGPARDQRPARDHGPAIERLLEAALAGYQAERPLSEREIDLAQFLAATGPFFSLTHWAIWHTTQRREFSASAAAIEARIAHLSRCLARSFGIE